MMRVEITDGSGTPRRRRLKDEDGGLLIVAWHHKNKKHHALQLRRRELLLLFAHQEHLLNVSGDVDVHQSWWMLCWAAYGSLVVLITVNWV